MTKTRGQRCQDKSGIYICDVVRNDEQGTLDTTQVLPPDDSRPAQQKHSGTQQEVMSRQTYPRDRPSQRPARIMIARARSSLTVKHLLEIADCAHRVEAGFAEIDLVAIFKGAHQFHSVQRTQAQV